MYFYESKNNCDIALTVNELRTLKCNVEKDAKMVVKR